MSFPDLINAMLEDDRARPFPINPLYIITRDGNVSNRSKTAWLKPCKLKRGGYFAVSLWENNIGKTWPIHQIVALTFIGQRPSRNHQAAHHNGIRSDNRDINIGWKTRAENEHDKVAHGTSSRRGRSVRILSKIDVLKIRDSAKPNGNQTQTSLAKLYGVSITHIGNILNRKRRIDV